MRHDTQIIRDENEPKFAKLYRSEPKVANAYDNQPEWDDHDNNNHHDVNFADELPRSHVRKRVLIPLLTGLTKSRISLRADTNIQARYHHIIVGVVLKTIVICSYSFYWLLLNLLELTIHSK